MGFRLYTLLSSQGSIIPGFALCLALGMAAVFSSPFWGVPSLILALFLGYVIGAPAREFPLYSGIEFSRQNILKLGVVLLGVRLDLHQVLALGWTPVLLVSLSVPLTILLAWVIGRWLRLPTECWLIGGAAVAICGASAAMAVAAVLSARQGTSRILPYIAASVTGIGSIAMISYPFLVDVLGINAQSAGVLIGISIHDVAQVAGAGYAISDTVGDVAIYTKMLRVAALVPVIAIIAIWQKSNSDHGNGLPGFLYAFAAIVTLNALGFIGDQVKWLAEELSTVFLVTAMVGLGAKIQFANLLGESWRPLFLLLVLSVLLFLVPLLVIIISGGF
ncbi:YeiH family protein [Oceanobacter sp. 3_MG-2023]|uniref:YeiH family protein n=1 Tax=Oceanobacter sp. 3_MG-2023 TaxID=3062622 RepID=UPI0027362F32|nr:putative sulfate exporter family transporter [Oceanobacter sp. 3_MG-2023]MDP2505532.1 putative sulfate exporter family transporter [Oceanobacter sp. 3_MG-2023]